MSRSWQHSVWQSPWKTPKNHRYPKTAGELLGRDLTRVPLKNKSKEPHSYPVQPLELTNTVVPIHAMKTYITSALDGG
jgi:hypothetical protein